ncbi:MAG: envelope stress response membrane protein PspB [Gammaproteobacteria bacterium]|nr:envelope stress response membrane protein PspB [Gammaproteobacteria bacterium]MYE84428.1 envelope stress response membrane protein PspB [Gammaproteobacteria bacterium]
MDNEFVFAFAFVPTLLFVVVVAPLWILMHYRSKNRTQGALSEEERAELERLTELADRMGERVETLEAILDAETPDWRKRQADA